MSEVAVMGVSKYWGTARAVENITLNAAAGELVVLLGPSGCGKSTTLRLIAGLEQADSGSIIIAGRDVTRLPPGERRIAMVFQSYALFPHLTVAENITFGLRARGVARAECRARLKRVAEIVGLDGLLDRKPAQLSGGQRQRVALGRAIIAEAPVCLMDEPLSNLDAKLRHEMRAEIRALQQRLGMTMIYVTHDQTEAMTMADRIVLMRDGRIEQNGAPQELYNRPATAFAARFIGTPPMNLLPGEDEVVLGNPAGASACGVAWGSFSQGYGGRASRSGKRGVVRHRGPSCGISSGGIRLLPCRQRGTAGVVARARAPVR
jgi:sn-glycerol 3-phosphate transport system ATP-binding protein